MEMSQSFFFLIRRITSSGDAEKTEGPRILFTGITPSEVSRLTEVCKVLILKHLVKCTSLSCEYFVLSASIVFFPFQIVIELGGTVVASVKQCTHLVTRKVNTLYHNYLQGLQKYMHINHCQVNVHCSLYSIVIVLVMANWK